MFTTAAVIHLQVGSDHHHDDDDTVQQVPCEKQEYFSQLQRAIEALDYLVHVAHRREDDTTLEEVLKDFLRSYDIVIVIGRLTSAVFNAAVGAYDEHPTDGSKSGEINANTDFKPFRVVHERRNRVLTLHRFYFVDYDSCADADFQCLLGRLEFYRRKPVYSKVFNYRPKDEKISAYMEGLLLSENGVKTRRVKDNEIVVSSSRLEEINSLQEHIVGHLGGLEASWVVDEENEERILSSGSAFIQEAIQHIKTCFEIYQPENVFISFNGGKDCTVLLHLMLVVLKRYYPNCSAPVFCMYVQSAKPFAQVDAFIAKLERFYSLKVHTLRTGIKDALDAVLHERPHLKACLMGTRRTDPFSANLRHFQATDNGWPAIMRVSPLLDWGFAHVWDYLIDYKVPYCELYDDGYTSLGNVDNTLQNPQLVDSTAGCFLPAYRLLTSTKERSGRM